LLMRSVFSVLLGSMVVAGCVSQRAPSASEAVETPAKEPNVLPAVPAESKRDAVDAPVASPPEEVAEAAPEGHRVEDAERWREDCDAIVKSLEASGEPVEDHPTKLPCTLTGDLDGDGRKDRVVLVAEKASGTPGFAVQWGSGGVSVLGGDRRVLMRGAGTSDDPDDEIDDETHESMAWLVDWKIAPMKNGKIKVRVLRRTLDLALPGLVGDALHVSGSDAAAIFYFDGTDWRWHHLGY
jgi:hypothetical protein